MVKRNTSKLAIFILVVSCRSRFKRAVWPALLGLAVPLAAVNAQAPASTTPPTASSASAPEAGTRTELLTSLRRIDAQLSTLTEAARPKDTKRLLELKAQFEVLILQAELEALRRENASLQAQRNQTQSSRSQSSQPQGNQAQGNQAQSNEIRSAQSSQMNQASGGAQSGVSSSAVTSTSSSTVSPLETEMSQMRRQFSRLAEQQENVTAQLTTIESQHALLLEELANATSDAPTLAPTPNPQEAQDPEMQAELADLRSRFAKLDSQQGEINEQLRTITDQHAELLDQLGATGDEGATSREAANAPQNAATLLPTSPRTYVVQPGDSLSEISKALYGTGARWPELLAANPALQDPDQLFAGTVLVIP